MSEEWGPWIEHDGKSRPADGLIVEREYACGAVLVGRIGKQWLRTELGLPFYRGATYGCSWLWAEDGDCVPVVRYRIRKPRGLTILESILADLPEKVDA